MTAQLVTAAISNAMDNRKRCGVTDVRSLDHHSNARLQHTTITFGPSLVEASWIATSIGSVRDSYDNALAASVDADHKTELVDEQSLFDGGTELGLCHFDERRQLLLGKQGMNRRVSDLRTRSPSAN